MKNTVKYFENVASTCQITQNGKVVAEALGRATTVKLARKRAKVAAIIRLTKGKSKWQS